MKARSIDEITKELENKENAAEEEVKELELKIEMQDAAIREHEKEMAEASDAGDVEQYVASKQEKQAAEDAREMYKTRLDKLTIAPRITEQEYNETIREIENAMDNKVTQTTKDVNGIFKSVNPYYNELREDVEKTNNALLIAFNMCYPGDKPKKENGSFASPKTYRGHTDIMIKMKNVLGRDNERDF